MKKIKIKIHKILTEQQETRTGTLPKGNGRKNKMAYTTQNEWKNKTKHKTASIKQKTKNKTQSQHKYTILYTTCCAAPHG